MFKKTINYEDFNGNQQSEEFYFNLSKAELVELQMSKDGGFGEYLEDIVKSNNGQQIMNMMKQIILMGYGEKSEDGKRFRKSDEIRADFEASPAYDVLFFELCTDDTAAAEFVNALMPKELMKQLENESAPDAKPGLPAQNTPAVKSEMTKEDLEKMLAQMKEQPGN